MKKAATILILLLISVFMLTGCAKCIDKKEESVGFPYTVLDRYLRTGEIDDLNVKAKIDLMHKRCLFKSEKIPVFNPELKVKAA